MTEIVVPTLGESVAEATVAQWLKKEGDSVEQDEAIVELETDKVTLEVNAPEAGVIAKITVGEGENVEVGAILGEIKAGAVAAKDQDNKKVETKSEVKEAEKSEKVEAGDHKLAPAVQKLVEEHNLNPVDIPASGKDGRLTKADVVDFMEGGASKPAAKDSSAPSTPSPSLSGLSRDTSEREEKVKMTKLRQTIANRLKEAQHTAAILTTFNEVDMTAVMNLRKEYKDRFEKKYGVKLGFMSFFVRAAVQALQEFPAVNAEISGTDIIYKNYYNIGVAVSTPQGLIVPVLRDADQKSMADVEKEIIDMGGRARDGKLGVEEMLGGTFTITNGGVFGSLMSTPILNAPQSAILGMHKIQQRPMVMPDGSIEARPMMYLALSYDHRIIDGRESVSFLVRIKEAIEDPQRLILNI
jgi:2-oxoglutarate dehydrogenase E2 component (dihydrolipoamide succinyltransferase)